MREPDTENCAQCGEPTELRGWVFAMPEGEDFDLDSLIKEEKPWCQRHFIENMFSLWPFSCTDECREAQCELLDIELKPEETWVWLHLKTVLVVGEKAEDDPLPGDPMKPRAPPAPGVRNLCDSSGTRIRRSPPRADSQKVNTVNLSS